MKDFRAQHPEFDWSKHPLPIGKPYVVFIATRNPGKPEEFKEPWVFNLDHTAGTFDHILRYQLKGFEPIGYGNLLKHDASGALSTSDTLSDEHAKIKAHIDQILKYKRDLAAKADAAVEARIADERRTLESRMEAERQKLADEKAEVERLEKERLALEEKRRALEAEKAEVAEAQESDPQAEEKPEKASKGKGK